MSAVKTVGIALAAAAVAVAVAATLAQRSGPPQQRTAVALYYLLDQPTSVVADYLGTTEATVRSHLRTARRRLHRQIGDDFKEGNG